MRTTSRHRTRSLVRWTSVALATYGCATEEPGAPLDARSLLDAGSGSGGSASTTVAKCGDGIRQTGEDCDDTDLGGATCAQATLGAQGLGTARCDATCRLDVSGCRSANARDAGSLMGAGGGVGTDAGSGASGRSGSIAPDPDCTTASHSGHEYWFCTKNLATDEARAKCQSGGGDLVTLGDSAEEAFVVGQLGPNQWIIGLNASTTVTGEWQWVDGSPVTYQHWGRGEPGKNPCAVMNGNGEWMDWACTNAENWICEVP